MRERYENDSNKIYEGNGDDMGDFFEEVETKVKQIKSYTPQTNINTPLDWIKGLLINGWVESSILTYQINIH